MKVVRTTAKTPCFLMPKTPRKQLQSGHEGESSWSDLPESSDDEDEDDDRTGAKYNTCNGDGDNGSNGRGERNTGAGGGSTKLLRFLSPSALTLALVAMENSKASSSTASRKKRSW